MKTCGNCHQVLPEDAFFFKNRAAGTLRSMCKVCCRVYGRRYYMKDLKAFYLRKNARQQSYFDRNRDFVANYLAKHPCVDCGETDIVVLDFDHVTGEKLENVSVLVANASSLKRISMEMTKCAVRCANCHRRKTAMTLGFWN
jgi:hypothetical protein